MPGRRLRVILALLIVSAILGTTVRAPGAPAPAAVPKAKLTLGVKETVVATFPPEGHWRKLVVTTAGRVLYTIENARTFTTYRDGKPIEGYDDLIHESIARSPDGSRYAFVATRGDKQFAVVDGEEGPPHHRIERFHPATPEYFRFSPDSRHVVYVAGHEDGRSAVVRDGKEEERYKEVGRLAFSPDSKHLAYPGDRVMIIDGRPHPEYKGLRGDGLVYSPDGAATAYATMNDGEVVVTGKHARQHRSDGLVRDVWPGPEGKVVLWDVHRWDEAKQESTSALYRDGKEILTLPESGGVIKPVVWSRDGRHVAYAVRPVAPDEAKDPGSILVLDGVEHATPLTIDGGTITFSPDGRRLGYVATEYLSDPPHSFATPLRRWVVIRDVAGGKETRLDGGNFFFTPGGRHVVRYREGLLAVDEAEVPLGRNDLPWTVDTDGAKAFRAIVVRKRQVVRLDVTLEEK